MKRRDILVYLGGVASLPFGVRAQPQGKVWRIGFLRVSRFSSTDSFQREAFLEAMRKLGYVEGKNFVMEWRFAEGDTKRLPEMASDLIRQNVDLIISAGTPATIAASKSTTTIPIVLINVADPVASGVAKSLARPGGNVTGAADLTGDLGPKNLEYLVNSVPGTSRVAVLFDPNGPGSVIISNAIQAAAQQARVTVLPVPASTQQEIEDAIPRMKQQKIGACIVAGGNLFTQHIRRIVELSIQHRLPTASTNFLRMSLPAR